MVVLMSEPYVCKLVNNPAEPQKKTSVILNNEQCTAFTIVSEAAF